MRKQDFFSKIGLRHFSPLTSEQLHAKNLRDPMVGSMRTFVTGQTEGILKDQTVLVQKASSEVNPQWT